MELLDLICHRKPERCFTIFGYTSPLCARCTAAYLTIIIFSTLFYYLKIYPPFYLAVLLMIPTAIDGFTQLFGYRESTNRIRIITGTLLGVAVSILIILIVFLLTKGIGSNNTNLFWPLIWRYRGNDG